VLSDRLMGVACLGAAAVAATWGGNGVLQRASALGAGAARPAAHADALAPPAVPPGPAAPPAADPSSTATTATPSTTATTRTAATTPSTRPGEAPAVLARRALLTQADVPAGFTVTTPAPPDGSSAAGDSAFEHCGGADAARLAPTIGARARSATFARPDTGSVSSSAVVFDQPGTAAKALDVMATPAARSCFEGLLNARLARNPRLSQDAKGSLAPAPSPGAGDGGVAYRFDVRLPAEDVDPGARPDDPPIRYVADLVFVRKARTLVLAEFDNLRQPWADQALKGVITALVAHV
jgi:hypothetical protein